MVLKEQSASPRAVAAPAPLAGARTRRRPWLYYLQRALAHLLLLTFSTMFIIPFLWLLSTSVKPESQIFVWPPVWIPQPITFEHYVNGLRFLPFGRFTLNSLIIALCSVVGSLLSCSLSAYGLARIRWPGRDLLFAVILATLMVPFQVRMVPLFIIFKTMGWIDTFLPLIVPHFFGNAFFTFLLRQFFLTIPGELLDAARIDGCSSWGIFWRIVIPLSKPALMAVAIFVFNATWNEFLAPLIYLHSPDKFTIALGLRSFQREHGPEWHLVMAASLLTMLPVLALFFFGQRYFIQGVVFTGVKG